MNTALPYTTPLAREEQHWKEEFITLQGSDCHIQLHYPIECEIHYLSDGVEITYPSLNLHGCGTNKPEALQDMADELAYLHNHSLLQQDDDHLTEYAKTIKYKALELVKEVVHG